MGLSTWRHAPLHSTRETRTPLERSPTCRATSSLGHRPATHRERVEGETRASFLLKDCGAVRLSARRSEPHLRQRSERIPRSCLCLLANSPLPHSGAPNPAIPLSVQLSSLMHFPFSHRYQIPAKETFFFRAPVFSVFGRDGSFGLVWVFCMITKKTIPGWLSSAWEHPLEKVFQSRPVHSAMPHGQT
jgi:hypothetical protein